MPIIETERIQFPSPGSVIEFQNLLQALSNFGITLTKEKVVLEDQIESVKYFFKLGGSTYILSFYNDECIFVRKADYEERISFDDFCKFVSYYFTISPFKDNITGRYNYLVSQRPLGCADYLFYLGSMVAFALFTLLVVAAIKAF